MKNEKPKSYKLMQEQAELLRKIIFANFSKDELRKIIKKAKELKSKQENKTNGEEK